MDNYSPLIELQTLDLELDKQEGLMNETLKGLADTSTVDQFTLKHLAIKEKLQELALSQSNLQLDLSEYQDKVISLKKRMYSGVVKKTKELTSLQDEISNFEKLHNEKEEVLLDLMLEIESCDSLFVSMDGKRSKAIVETQERHGVLELNKRNLEKMISGQKVKRDRVIQKIPESILASYTQIRTKKGGVAVLQLSRDMCGMCRIVIPSSELQEMKRSKDLKLCSGCGRMIIVG